MSTVAARPHTRQPSPWRLGWRIARYRPGIFMANIGLWTAFYAIPAAAGLVLRAIFDRISGADVGFDLPSLVALLLAVEGARLVVLLAGVAVFMRWWARMLALLRSNLLAAQLANRHEEQGAPAASAGAAIPVFRDDVEDLVRLVDTWLDLTGTLTFGAIALAIMATVDPLLTLVVALPLVAVFVVLQSIAGRIRHARRDDREATVRVTGLLGSLFASVQTVKVAGAEDQAIARLRERNAHRRRTALRDRLLNDSLEAFSGSTVDFSIGLVLLLVAGSMRSGDFTVGDLALFASYITWLASVPRWAGLLITRHRHAEVAAARMGALMPRGDAIGVVAHRDLHLASYLSSQRPSPRPRQSHPGPAEIELVGFGTGDGRVRDVDLLLPAGSFTVVCGEVGSGKSSLLRALLGLAGPTEGTLRWNGHDVEDLAAHMTPPRCAYVPQVPRLFSATLRENLTVGLATPDASLAEALRTAAFDEDLADMREGLDTVVGPRGVRLSGGQIQRAATSRALVADPGLLILDDLSSALDAATERQVWERVTSARRATVLAVSHRAGALERADQVVVLAGGQVAAIGTLEGLRAVGVDPLGTSGGSP